MASSSCSCSAAAEEQENLIYSLFSLSRQIADSKPPRSILQKKNISSFLRKTNNLFIFFEDLLLRVNIAALSTYAILCLQEIHYVLRRFGTLLHTCSFRYSRTRLALQSNSVSDKFRHLNHDLFSLLDIFPIDEVDVSSDVRELVRLVKNQCRRHNDGGHASQEDLLLNSMLAMVDDIEREIVPQRYGMETMFQKLGINSSDDCKEEIAKIESEIRDGEIGGTGTGIALHGLVLYAKCVLFGASTPRRYTAVADETGQMSRTFSNSTVVIPDEFRCPVSLDVMKDPVVVESGQTYDRHSIDHWIKSGHKTCPATGQSLASPHLIPNLTLKNLIKQWCCEQKLPFDVKPTSESKCCVRSSKASLEAARMTVTFLVKKLSSPNSTEASNRIVHELRQLSKIGSENRAFIAEAGAIPLLLPFLKSSDPSLQVNAITAILNLSIMEDNKKIILKMDGSLDSIITVMNTGATWNARENAAVTLLSLASLHVVCRKKIGRKAGVVEGLVKLVLAGPSSSKLDGLRAILGLAGVRDNIDRLVKGGVISVALGAMRQDDLMETAVAVLAAVARRGGAEAMGELEGFMEKTVWVMKHGSDIAREVAAETLVYVCKLGGHRAVEEYSRMPGIEWVVWEMMASGTARGKRKAAALGRIRRRWLLSRELNDRSVDDDRNDIIPQSGVMRS